MDKIVYGLLVTASIINGEPKMIEVKNDHPPIVQVITPFDTNGWTEFTDPLFEKIAYCESKNDLQADNPGSTADGEFQFLDGTWKWYGQKLWGDDWINKNKKSLDNRELAWYVYTHYGTSDWEADIKSYNCWKSEIPNAKHKNII